MDYKIVNSALSNLVEPHLRDGIVNDSYTIKTVSALSLLTPNRFDIAFKLFYLRCKEFNERLANDVYSIHLNVSTGGTFAEFGNKDKVGLEKFKADFSEILQSMSGGFNSKKSIVPLCSQHAVANGAHRIAAGIFLNQSVATVDLDISSVVQDYKYFRKNGVDEKSMDLAALEYCRYADNIYLAVLWPAAEANMADHLKSLPNIVYSKDVKFSPNGAINLISVLYNREDWLGAASENYPGAAMKVGECFPSYELPVKFVLFQSSMEQVSKIKESIRAEANIGKSSVHITDTSEETRSVATAILNDNSVHFLNNSNQKWTLEIISNLRQFETHLSKRGLTSDNLVIDGGTAMQAYGLRKADDVDVICLDEHKQIVSEIPNLDVRSFDGIYHGIDFSDLIYDPSYYFYFGGFKFISMEQLYSMKQERRESKDIVDSEFIKPLLGTRPIFNKLHYKSLIFIRINKYKVKVVKILNYLGVYKYIRPVYKWVMTLIIGDKLRR